MPQFNAIARLRVELIVEAESRDAAIDFVRTQLEGTQCWQAWSEPCNTEGLVKWVSGEPEVSSVVVTDCPIETK